MKTTLEKIKINNIKGEQKNGFRITITSNFDASIDVFWRRIQNVSSLVEICKPLVSFKSYSGEIPSKWDISKIYQFKLSMYQIFPSLKHTICIHSMNSDSYEVISAEYNKVVTIWNHIISMQKLGDNKVTYTDVVDIYAGKLTYVVALWAIHFYKHRQKKWKKLMCTR